ncbi:hypothetical protein DFA_00264 [Cavenderia fasciculata]|uniref:Transmembrane protein n=1 Tax=Cavenderia fasciculata TaxID=261658 RepID=F4PY26_CACFS|nr:uncharacterized protein DFA_00264 [Cavenderia fasciculata]EGG19686.1 hypothetical protein DFA_00264 [Cavenderia fasciculata]|eukprot:XP_004357980.1 hypothetical protein DFA_00264 [Cavenderia fasciculata]
MNASRLVSKIKYIFGNQYVIPATLTLACVAFRFVDSSEMLSIVNDEEMEEEEENNNIIQDLFENYPFNIGYVISRIEYLVYVTNNSYTVCRRLATPESIRLLVQIAYRQNRARVECLEMATNHQRDFHFITLFSSLVESPIIVLVSNLIRHFSRVQDIPFYELIRYANWCGFPIKIMVGNMLAKYLIEHNNTYQVAYTYTTHKVLGLFKELLEHEVANEFADIRRASLLVVHHLPTLKDTEEDMIPVLRGQTAPSFMSNLYYKLNTGTDIIPDIWFSSLPVFFGTTMAWKKSGGSIKYTACVGLAIATFEYTRWKSTDLTETLLKKYTNRSSQFFDLTIGGFTLFHNFWIFKQCPLAIIGYYGGRYILNIGLQLKKRIRYRYYLQSNLYKTHCQSKFIPPTSLEYLSNLLLQQYQPQPLPSPSNLIQP